MLFSQTVILTIVLHRQSLHRFSPLFEIVFLNFSASRIIFPENNVSNFMRLISHENLKYWQHREEETEWKTLLSCLKRQCLALASVDR